MLFGRTFGVEAIRNIPRAGKEVIPYQSAPIIISQRSSQGNQAFLVPFNNRLEVLHDYEGVDAWIFECGYCGVA